MDASLPDIKHIPSIHHLLRLLIRFVRTSIYHENPPDGVVATDTAGTTAAAQTASRSAQHRHYECDVIELVRRDVEAEGLIEDRVRDASLHRGLLGLNDAVKVAQSHFDVRVYGREG